MEFEFDKEIDAILRKARESEFAFTAENHHPHLDADEISAFAENSLPDKTKFLYTEHFADCDRCRKILADIILLNAEAENVPAFVASEEIISAPAVPWYRRLFAFPNLAYSLGALTLIFAGLIGFTLLQNFNTGEISQMSNKASSTKNAPDSTANNTSATSNTTAANSAVSMENANSASTANLATNSAASNSSVADSEIAQSKSVSEQNQPTAAQNEANNSCQDCGSPVGQATPQPMLSAGNTSVATERDSKDEAEKNVAQDRQDVTRSQQEKKAVTTGEVASTPREETRPNTALKKQNPSSATTGNTMRVGGKTFNRRDNVWYDSSFSGQATVNITRGTNEYKKLDKDLRQTVERLGGTVVIVWKTKAYRIQ